MLFYRRESARNLVYTINPDGAEAAGWRSVLEMHALNAVSCALFFTYCAVSCVKQPKYPRVINYVNNIPSDVHRQKRAGKVLGIATFKAIQSLLRDAVEVVPTGSTRQYVKPGNYVTASKDFIRTHAFDRETFRLPGGHTGLSGKIGDGKVVILRTSKQDGKPVIIVKDTGDGTTAEEITHRIKYTGYEY